MRLLPAFSSGLISWSRVFLKNNNPRQNRGLLLTVLAQAGLLDLQEGLEELVRSILLDPGCIGIGKVDLAFHLHRAVV